MNLINSLLPDKVSDVIKSYITDFEASDRRKQMIFGEDYYRSRNTAIMDRQMLIYAEEEGVPYEMEDPYKANHKLPAGYMKILVDQKINYSLGKNLTIEAPNVEILHKVLGREFQSKLRKIGKEAAKKSVGWGHPYLGTDGTFQVAAIPAEQVIPIYSTNDNTQLEITIRYYKVKLLNKNNEPIISTRVEVWDNQQVTYYQQNEEAGAYDLLTEDEMAGIFGKPYTNPKYHFNKDMKHGTTITKTEGLAWGIIPFIPLHNNDEGETDLQPIKPFIDAYDIVNSDFVNNLEDFQDIYWILKGYDGSGLSQFLHQVKRYKTLKVSEGGDARAERIDVPFLARKEAKAGLEQDIFSFAMGVNPNSTGDGNVTNVVIRSRFAALDLKAAGFENEVEDYLFQLMEFVNKYQELRKGKPIEIEDIIFDRAIIVNEIELLNANKEQLGSISEDTRLSNHPWVSDVDGEIKRMAEESEKTVDLDKVIPDEPTE